MVAASAKAATKPNAGCTGSSAFAAMNIANVAASTSVASGLTRRSSAARAASAGLSNDEGGGNGHDGFRMNDAVHRAMRASLRAQRSDPASQHGNDWIASVASAPRNDASALRSMIYASTDKKKARLSGPSNWQSVSDRDQAVLL